MIEKRLKTGVAGIDQMLLGGFIMRTVNLVSGPPGSGKSLLGLHYVVEGAKNGEIGIYISMEESSDSILESGRRYDFDVDAFVNSGRIIMVDVGWLREKLEGSEGSIYESLEHLRSEGKKHMIDVNWYNPTTSDIIETEYGLIGFDSLKMGLEYYLSHKPVSRLVIDSLSAVALAYPCERDFRKELFKFCRFLRKNSLTTLFISEFRSENDDRYGVEHYIADTSITLNLINVKGELKRMVWVQKMRFSSHDTGIHPFTITNKGMSVNIREFIRL